MKKVYIPLTIFSLIFIFLLFYFLKNQNLININIQKNNKSDTNKSNSKKNDNTENLSDAEKIYEQIANSTQAPNPTIAQSSEPKINQENQDQLLYTNSEMKFSINYPKDLKPLTLQDGYISFYRKGPTQEENTEFYDGISLSIISIPTEEKSILELIENERTNIIDIYGPENVSIIDPITINNHEGFIFNDDSVQFIFVNQNNDKYLQILNMTKDPGKLGYTQTAFDMIKSITILD